MRSALLLLATLASCPLLSAQDMIFYKFDSACSDEVINYAVGPQALPSNGTLQTTSTTSPWTQGVFGTALAGGGSGYYNRVVSGWDPGAQPVNGDVTIAFFMRETTAPGTSLSYLMGAPSGGFRLFTNGIAGRGLYQRVLLASGGNGTNSTIANDFYLPATTVDVQTLAAAGWVHVAMVVDSTAQTADWYVNGTSVLQLSGVAGGAAITAAGPFQVGYYSNASYYAFDEFLVSLRAYTPSEVMALATSAHAGDGRFDSRIPSQCGSTTLSGNGTAPALGNIGYGIDLSSSATGVWSMNLGTGRCSLGGVIQLPFDMGRYLPSAAGCWVLTDSFASIGGGVIGAPVQIPLVIPPLPTLSGLVLYAQAIVLDAGGSGNIEASNGLAIGIGN